MPAPEPPTYYDRWCHRAVILTRIQFVLTLIYAGVIASDGWFKRTFGHYAISYALWPVWERIVAIAPVCLALINCDPRAPLRKMSKWPGCACLGYVKLPFYDDELQRLLVFAISQSLQLSLCTLLPSADFIRLGPILIQLRQTSVLRFSLFFWFVPAVVAFVHGIIGPHAFCSHCGPRIELGLSDPPPQYNDFDDDSPLARAFHSQQPGVSH